ncbi:hypothetical protein CMV_018369, partial [Castanea mollissima]
MSRLESTKFWSLFDVEAAREMVYGSGSGFSRDSQAFPNGFPYPDLAPAIRVIPGIGSFHEGLCYFHGGLATQNFQKIVNKMGILSRSPVSRKPNETMRLIVTTFVGVVLGFFIGVSFPTLSLTKLNLPSSILPSMDLLHVRESGDEKTWLPVNSISSRSTEAQNLTATSKIWVPSNPKGAERLAPQIVAAESDFYLRRLWGNPNE